MDMTRWASCNGNKACLWNEQTTGKTPIEKELATVLTHSSVSFHLLPLARSSVPKATPQPGPQQETPRKRSRSPSRPRAMPKPKAKGGGKGKNKNKRGCGPNVPEQLINKARETKDGKRLCWAFNLPNGCNKAPPGGSCDRGAHLCAISERTH